MPVRQTSNLASLVSAVVGGSATGNKEREDTRALWLFSVRIHRQIIATTHLASDTPTKREVGYSAGTSRRLMHPV